MSGDETNPKPKPRRAGPIRTAPLEDSDALRAALQRELHKAAAPSLVVISGPDVGLRVRLQRSMDIGRDPTSSFVLRDESISWRHLRVEDRGAGEWALVDMGSTNGTIINTEKCSGEHSLRPGDKIMIGKTVLEFQLADAIREGFNAELQRLLHVDELSGLWVKRRFDSQLETVVKAVLTGSMPVVSVIVMDMDGVKAINDTHGHAMGAYCIGEAGHVIGHVLEAHPSNAFATRFGGDEFAAALPCVPREEACKVAEEVRRAVIDHVYEKGGVRVHPGMSAGVAALPGDAQDAEGVFRAADQAMYRAKRAGKNRVSL
jgi:diguanylate cyclase (GGDEF)-like protein